MVSTALSIWGSDSLNVAEWPSADNIADDLEFEKDICIQEQALLELKADAQCTERKLEESVNAVAAREI